ncbi:MAG: hypothetical protein R2695_06580 [Acidimicrobiales bacterium]
MTVAVSVRARRRGSRWAPVLVIGAILGIGSPLAVPARAQEAGSLDLKAQTIFVDERPVEFVVRASGAIDDAWLRVEVFGRPRTTRDALREAFAARPSGTRLSLFECPLEGPCDAATLTRTADGLVTVTLLDAEIGESLRRAPGPCRSRSPCSTPTGAPGSTRSRRPWWSPTTRRRHPGPGSTWRSSRASWRRRAQRTSDSSWTGARC